MSLVTGSSGPLSDDASVAKEARMVQVVVERCAGLDVHKDTVVACVRTPAPDGSRTVRVRTFGTMTVDLLALRDWLVAEGVTVAAMESTGVYWKPVFYALEDAVECWLLNAQHMRNVPGRKTDVADATWIGELIEHGLLAPCFVPPPPIRELRNLTRYRKTQIEERTREVQRLDKILQDAGVKLSSVATDILGISGRAMLATLVGGRGGPADPDAIADLARGRLRAKIPALRQALTGRFARQHAIVVGEILAHLDYLDEAIGRISDEIDQVMAPFATERDLLTTIPGVDRRIAEALIAEIGVDMSRFGDAKHLASWAGICPAQRESAGTTRAGPPRHGNSWLQRHLIVAAMAAGRSKNTYLGAKYRRLATRRGTIRARRAVAHSILSAAFYILAAGVPYQDLGPDHFVKLADPARRARQHLGHLKTLGWNIAHDNAGNLTLTPPGQAA